MFYSFNIYDHCTKIRFSLNFQATELKYIKRAMEGLSKTEIKLTVEVQYLAGTLALNIPPPPSDRVWIGFRGNPELQLSATPTFGERSINYVSRWIEKKLAVEFQVCFYIILLL